MVDDPRDVVEEEAGVDGVQHGPGARHTEVQLHVAVPTEAATTTAYQQHTHTERNREAHTKSTPIKSAVAARPLPTSRMMLAPGVHSSNGVFRAEYLTD